jgi:hypothetical protein
MCVCVGGWVGGWVGAWGSECVPRHVGIYNLEFLLNTDFVLCEVRTETYSD